MFGVRALWWTLLLSILSVIRVDSASTQWFDSTPLLQQQQQQQTPQVPSFNIPVTTNQNAQPQELRFGEPPTLQQQFQQPTPPLQQQQQQQQQQQNFQDQLQQQQLVQQQLQLVQQQLQQLSAAAVQHKVDQRQQQQPPAEPRQSVIPPAAAQPLPADALPEKPQPKPAVKATPPAKGSKGAAEKNSTGTPSSSPASSNKTEGAATRAPAASWMSGFEPLVSAGVATLGATMGKEQCRLKAACLVASMLPNVQGRDLVIVAAERLVPEDWKPIYNAARSSLLQGQSCLQYDCTL